MRRREFIVGLGGAAAWPMAARAQQGAMPVIGYLSGNTETAFRGVTAAFRQGLSERGYVEGRNIEILYRWAESRNERLPSMAADLVRRRVDVIFANAGTAPALVAQSATAVIPIVFAVALDPVELGLVASLNRPGGNATGVSFPTTELLAKRLDLLHEIVPAVTSIGFLVNPTNPTVETQLRAAQDAARILGLRLVMLSASSPNEIEAAFAVLSTQRIGALMTGADPLFFDQAVQLAALAARHSVPAVYANRETVDAGGLMSYETSLSDAWRLAGTYAGRILKGEKAADLPVQQVTKVELVINMKTAKALGITFPLTFLGRADEVIE
jgi:putative ABC transport system substrate-binding protein